MYAVIYEADYYGPSTERRASAVYDTLADAQAHAASDPGELAHNMSGHRYRVGEILDAAQRSAIRVPLADGDWDGQTISEMQVAIGTTDETLNVMLMD